MAVCRGLAYSAIIWTALASCGRGSPDPAPAREPGQSTEEGHIRTSPLGPGASDLTGSWELRSDPAQPMPGFRLSLTVDSVVEGRYFGRITNFFSGNVGRNPREFETFSDSILPGGRLTIPIRTVEGGPPRIRLEGTLQTDTIRLHTFVLGPDTLSNSARQWMLVRKRSNLD